MSARRSIAQLFGSQLASIAAMAVSVAVLARLLSQSDFGIFALALAWYQLARILVLLGLRHVLVRERELSDTAIAQAGAVSLSLSLGLFAATLSVVMVMPTSWMSGEVKAVTLLMSATVVTVSLALPIEIALERLMRFGLRSVAALTRTVSDGAVAISLALAGFGAEALAAGFFLSHVVALLVLSRLAPAAARVRPRFGKAELHWRAQAGILSTSILARSGDLILAGVINGMLGVAALGLYNRAQVVNSLFYRVVLEGIQPSILTSISRSLERGNDGATINLTNTRYLAILCWPSFSLIILLAPQLVAVILGAQWESAVPLVQILAIGGFALPVTQLSMDLFVAIRLMDTYLRIIICYHCILVIGAIIASFHSLEAVCAVMAGALIMKGILVTYALKRRVGHHTTRWIAALGEASVASLATIAGPLAVIVLGNGLSDFFMLAFAAPLAGLGWLAATTAMRHPIIPEMIAALRDTLSPHGASAGSAPMEPAIASQGRTR